MESEFYITHDEKEMLIECTEIDSLGDHFYCRYWEKEEVEEVLLSEHEMTLDLLTKLVLTLDAYEGGDSLVSNQGQAMDGYSALANFKSIAEEARDLLTNKNIIRYESESI